MPSRYVVVEWELWHSMGMHQFPVDHFIIYYLIDNEKMTVTVVRVLYSGRDIEEFINLGE